MSRSTRACGWIVAFALASTLAASAAGAAQISAKGLRNPLANLPAGLPAPNPQAYNLQAEQSARTAPKADFAQPMSSAVQYLDSCTLNNWNAVQAVANGLVMGNCQRYALLYQTTTAYAPSTGDQSPYYYGGYINGDYNGCGWINANRITYSGTVPYTGACPNPDTPDKSTYVYCISAPCGGPNGESTNLAIWTSTNPENKGNNGISWNTVMDKCKEYANYHPWASGQTELSYTGVDLPLGTNVLLRYLAKYVSADGSGYYAMVQDNGHADNRWSFIPWSCIVGPY